jgi:transposase-like protein
MPEDREGPRRCPSCQSDQIERIQLTYEAHVVYGCRNCHHVWREPRPPAGTGGKLNR